MYLLFRVRDGIQSRLPELRRRTHAASRRLKRCVMPTLKQDELPQDPSVLRTIMRDPLPPKSGFSLPVIPQRDSPCS
jgi:hypothetical protein